MELQDYLRILRRRWAIVVATTLVALTVAALLTYRATPQYTSTARVFISTAPSDADSAYQGSLFSQQRVASYADIVTGLELTQRVVDSLDLDMTAEELADELSATVVPDTVLLKISMTDPSPVLAQRITNATVTELSEFVEDLETPAGKKRALVKATMIDPARVAETPTSPNPTRNLGLALVLGLLLGFGIAVLRELLDTTIKTDSDVEKVSGAPLLGGIGEDPDAAREPLITALSPHDPRAEAFRVLRTNVQFLEVDNPTKAFVVTSSVPAEGKSSIAINLAVSLAQSGQKVLLLDADLRRPRVADRLGLEAGVGLTTVLLGKVSFEDALQEDSASGLTVLTSGATPPNPAELLQSHAMADVLAHAREQFDVVVLDSPPLLPVTDGALLASLTDGAILVARHGKTTREQLAGAVERLRGVGTTPLGVVLNRTPRKSTGYGYGYGYGYAPESATTGSGSRWGRGSARSAGEKERMRDERRAAKAQLREDRREARAGARRSRQTARADERARREDLRAERIRARAEDRKAIADGDLAVSDAEPAGTEDLGQEHTFTLEKFGEPFDFTAETLRSPIDDTAQRNGHSREEEQATAGSGEVEARYRPRRSTRVDTPRKADRARRLKRVRKNDGRDF